MSGSHPRWLHPSRYDFPDPATALDDPNGLVAIGGDLAPGRILTAYRAGIFPWFSDDSEPIMWWSPDPRAILRPESVKISRSLRKRLNRGEFSVTFDTAFRRVVAGCAQRGGRDPRTSTGTWITPAMAAAYGELHVMGVAHSVECWQDNELVGGLYGLSLGRLFFGESMFSRATDASKVALVVLAQRVAGWQFPLIDCQMMNPHLQTMGAVTVSRDTFLADLAHNLDWPDRIGPWTRDTDPDYGNGKSDER